MAIRSFSHDNLDLHNYAMRLGVDRALCLKLGYVVVTYAVSSEQIGLVCQCLVKAYQCSIEHRINSFREIGASEIVPLLVQVWKQEQQLQATDHPTKGGPLRRCREHILLSTLKVLRIYAKLDESAKTFLIQYNQGSLMVHFIQMIISYCDKQQLSPMSRQSPDLIVELLGIVKDLTFRSNTADKEFLLWVHDGLFKHALNKCFTMLISNSKMAELLTAITWNLVLSPSISVALLQQQDELEPLVLPRTLCRILTTTTSHIGPGTTPKEADPGTPFGHDVRNFSIKTRRNAISALGNLLLEAGNQRILFRRSVLKQLNLIPTLMSLVQHDLDSITRRRSMRTIRLLSSATQGPPGEDSSRLCPISCLGMLLENDIVPFLAHVISRNVDEDDENDRDTQIQACESVIALAKGGLYEDEAWPNLEKALIQRVETTTDPRLTLVACRCLSLCVAGTKSWMKMSSSFSDMFWKRLECTVTTYKDSHVGVSHFLLQLAQQEANGKPSPSLLDSASSLSCGTVVNTLTHLLSEPGSQFEDSRDNALKLVLVLVRKEVNKRPLAENENLLTALVNLCLLQPPGPSGKRELAKRLILMLVPEL
jgi:hypothetical protein